MRDFEVDARLSGGILSGTTHRVVVLNNESYTQNGKYSGFSYSFNADFG